MHGGQYRAADSGADTAGRVQHARGQPAAVDHVAQAGAAGGVRGQRRRRPGGRARPVPDGAGPEARPGRQHGLVLHQQDHAGRQTGRSGARVAHAAARPQLRAAAGQQQQPQVPVGGHRVAHRPAGPLQGPVHEQSDVTAVRRACTQSAARQGVSKITTLRDTIIIFINYYFISTIPTNVGYV